jgi:hypothetical protein
LSQCSNPEHISVQIIIHIPISNYVFSYACVE